MESTAGRRSDRLSIAIVRLHGLPAAPYQNPVGSAGGLPRGGYGGAASDWPAAGELHANRAAARLNGSHRSEFRIAIGRARNFERVRAQQRVEAAVAVQQRAAAQALPNLNLGASFDNHTGALQQDSGNILSVDRSALVAGAGVVAVSSSTLQIPGLEYNLNLSESLYGYLVSRQVTRQREFEAVRGR